MNRWLSLALLIALLGSSVVLAPAASAADTLYIVQRGDTLARIAARFGVTVAAIIRANGIQDANRLYVGQRLIIPTGSAGSGSNSGALCSSPFVVQRGDTLGKIAAKCGVTASAIIAANNLKNIHLIFVGQKLIIPAAPAGASRSSTAAPTASATPGQPSGVVGPATIANPSFELGWTTDGVGNQTPNGWSIYSPPRGATLPFANKGQEGARVPAISNGPGEYVHKLSRQLPPEEQLGRPRALLLEGETVYKAFGMNGAHALVLSQMLSSRPGDSIRLFVHILGETADYPTNAAGKLEDDHFVALVRLGAAEDWRTYAAMRTRFDVPGNQRPWNRFVVTARVPASGRLLLEIILQQNWPGRTDFFIDRLSGETLR